VGGDFEPFQRSAIERIWPLDLPHRSNYSVFLEFDGLLPKRRLGGLPTVMSLSNRAVRHGPVEDDDFGLARRKKSVAASRGRMETSCFVMPDP
jgi:hypothetical protein